MGTPAHTPTSQGAAANQPPRWHTGCMPLDSAIRSGGEMEGMMQNDLTLPEHQNATPPRSATWWECPTCGDYAWLWVGEDAPLCDCDADTEEDGEDAICPDCEHAPIQPCGKLCAACQSDRDAADMPEPGTEVEAC